MTMKFKQKHTENIVTEICHAVVQASIFDIYHGGNMVLYRGSDGGNWLRDSKLFMEKFKYVVPHPSEKFLKPHWTHKEKGGVYQVIHDPIVCQGSSLCEMEMAVVFEYEDGRRCAMRQSAFIREFEPHHPKPIWFKAPHKMTVDGVEIREGDKVLLKHQDGFIVSRFSPFVPDAPSFKASQKQMAKDVAAKIHRARMRSGGDPVPPKYKYVADYVLPLPGWSNNPGIASINGKTPEEFAKTGDIYKDVANHLQLEMRAQHAQNFVQYYKDGVTHVAFVKRMGHKGVPIRGDNLEEVMNAASALLYARVG